MIKYPPFATGLVALLVAITASGLFLSRDASAAGYFNPCGTTSLSVSSENAPADITTQFGIGLDPSTCGPITNTDINPNQYNAGALIYFTPSAWGVTKSSDVPIGTKIGTAATGTTVGLLNNGCNTVLSVNFDLYNGTIDQAGPTVAELPPLDANGNPNKDRLSPMKPPTSGGVPAAASAWPTYLNDVATKAGMDLSGLIARYVGVDTHDVPFTTVVLQVLVFKPGATVSSKIQLDQALGYPAVPMLNDPASGASATDSISGFCAPLWTKSTLTGSAGGVPFRTNPANGAYDFVTYAAPQPDADNDGIENSLDPCPYTANASGWDPRAALEKGVTVGDLDADGLPVDCDPDPNTPSLHSAANGATNSDEDGDGWQNRGDNCPLVANPDQKDTDGDGIGDACDQNPTVVDGAHPPVCIVNTVTVGSGGTAPADPTALAPCNPAAVVGQPAAATDTPGPTPTFIPGTTTRPTNSPAPAGVSSGGVGSGPAGGIGTLAPAGTSIPAWAAMLAALGALGLCLGFGLMGARIRRRR